MSSLDESQVSAQDENMDAGLWSLSATLRALVSIRHGYVEHRGRCEHVADALVASGMEAPP